MKLKRIGWIGVFVALGVQLVGPAAALAASATPPPVVTGQGSGPKPLSLTISPLVINLKGTPGKTVTTDLRVKQEGGNNERLKVGLQKFGADGNTGKPTLADRGPHDDYFDWVHFDRPQFDAPNGVWQTVHVTINLPKTAAFGYYYAVTFTRADPAQAGARSSVVNGATAVLILLEAYSPNAKRTLKVDAFSTNHSIYEFLPATFNIELANTGNVHTIPAGSIFISHGNRQIEALDINSAQGNVLPNTKRVFNVDWNNGFPHYEKVTEDGKVKTDAVGNPKYRLVWDIKQLGKIRFGKYTARMLVIYDDGKRDIPVEAYVSFWVIPWRILLSLVLIVSLIIGGIYMTARGAWRGVRGFGRRRP
jgi:hypothetical protein